MLDSFMTLAAAGLAWLPVLAMAGLAVFFGRTLRDGEMPLIERMARIRKPALSPAVSRYTRRLTTLWCGYFVAAAAVMVGARLGFVRSSLVAASASLLLYVGEYAVRRWWLFPGEWFPNFPEQLSDTWQGWRSPRGDGSKGSRR